MSYCVNCGVKLEESLTKCPLCNTPVINPNILKKMEPTPAYPQKSATMEEARRHDRGILLTIVLSATAISCGLLNLLVFRSGMWSLLIIGACILIWVFALPTVIYSRIPIYFSLLFDGFAVAIYLYMISRVTPSEHWFFSLALPITLLVTFEMIVFAFLYRKVSHSFLAIALYFFIEMPILCIGIELLTRLYFAAPVRLVWSAIVLVPCVVIVFALITVLSRKRLRDSIRRRLHF